MAHPDHRYAFGQTANDHLDLEENDQHVVYDDEEPTLLDPSVFAPDMMQHPSSEFTFRKDSFASNHPVMTPDNRAWGMQHFAMEGGNDNVAGSSNFPQSMQLHQHQISDASMEPQNWSLRHDSSESTPNAHQDTMPTTQLHYNTPPFVQQGMERSQSQFEHAHGLLPQSVGLEIGLSDQQHYSGASTMQHMQGSGRPTEWMTLAQQENEAKPGPKRMRPHSPPRPLADLRNRDGGIQKKNKRIDIPQERNIQTIDQMIETTKDEDLLKELKAQKRLLRNREAALASRQRKKKHTEDLETKEKDYQTRINGLQAQLEQVSLERDQYSKDRQILMHQQQEADRHIEVMQIEKRDMIMKHNEDTASLRKKIQILTEQLDHAPAMSTVPSSSGFTDFNAEMEALSMDPHNWDNFLLIGDLHPENTSEASFDTLRPEPMTQSVTIDKKPQFRNNTNTVKSQAPVTDQTPVASGLLFMLLLCGAFVASKGPTISSVDLPAMPDNVRNAAPTVLHNLLSEDTTSGQQGQRSINAMLQQSSKPSIKTVPRSSNRMMQMHRSLTAPTRQQEIDSAFSLTPAQYASHTNYDTTLHESPLPAKRTLGEALAGEQPNTGGNKAEIYTRSLLWEQIPTDVVNQFKELVRDHHEIETQEQLLHANSQR